MPVTINGGTGITYTNNTNQNTGDGPAFSVWRDGGQAVNNNVETKIAFNAEIFDTANCFDTTTNNRFTPNVPGYYQINITVDNGFNTSSGISYVRIFKNGSSYLEVFRVQNQPNTGIKLSGSVLLFLNGSTDYVEAYFFQNSGSNYTLGSGISSTQMSGALVRGA